MGKNRDRLSLVAAILEASNGGATKTRIMFNANLSFKLLEKYLNTANKLGFIRQIESHYILTMKGREFLNEYKDLTQQHNAALKTLNELRHKIMLLESRCQENPPQIQIKTSIGKNQETD